MKKLSKNNLPWWGIILLMTCVSHPAFSQLETFYFPTDLRDLYETTVFQDALYMSVNTGPLEGSQLCKFDGEYFTVIRQPSTNNIISPNSPMVVYNGNLYMIVTQLSDSHAIPPDPALYRYNGTTFTPVDIPFDRVPTELAGSDMQVYDGRLYVDVAVTELDVNTAFVAYDGTNFELIEFPAGMISEDASGMTVYNGKLFRFLKAGRTGIPQLVSYDGTSFEFYDIPNLVKTEPVVYNDHLILTQAVGTDRQLLAFNGTSASFIATPGLVARSGRGAIYDGLLYLRMADVSTHTVANKLTAYDGSSFSPVATIDGMFSNFNVWRDKLWFAGTGTWSTLNLYSYQPPEDEEYPIYDFEHIDVDLFAQGRGWCWNEIIIDWEIVPICRTPPNCPEGSAPIDVTLFDKDKEVWKSVQKEPFTLNIPVADNPYTLSLSGENKGEFQSMITVDPNLVGIGIETIKLGLKPHSGNVNISLSTKKGQAVPVTLSFLNDKGAAVWQENLIAPAQKQLVIPGTQRGTKFLLSPTGATLESAGITATSYYPNPFDGKITVDIQTKGDKLPVQVTIDDPNGKRVWDATLTAPVKQTLELKDKKQGIYVLTFSAGKASRQALIELK